MKYLVISCSHNPDSRSRGLATAAFDRLKVEVEQSAYLDISKLELPLCDGAASYELPIVGQVTEQIEQARAILMAMPVYNFDINAAAKNLVELTGQAWNDKIVGFLCAAGGQRSYMSVMSFANSLMLDFRCLIVPRFVYATKQAFEDGKLIDSDVETRIVELVNYLVRITEALVKS